MNWTEPPPLMRGDLFTLLEPTGRSPLYVDKVLEGAQDLALQIETGLRHEGPNVLMQCLQTLVELGKRDELSQALPIIASVHQRLSSLGTSQWSEELRTPVERRGLVLPQRNQAQLLRALPAPRSEAWFLALREVVQVHAAQPELESLFPDSAEENLERLGRPILPMPEVNYRLFRFGRQSSDIVGCMNVIQEPGAFAEAFVAGDGERVAMLIKDVVGVFEHDGNAVLSGRIPSEGEERDRVQAMALLGGELVLAMKTELPDVTEIISIDVDARHGKPCGILRDKVELLAVSEDAIYVLAELRLIRLPRIHPDEPVVSFHFHPWFAEYAWTPHWRLQAAMGKVWLSNGRKLIVLDAGLTQTLREIVLPEVATDFFIHEGDLWLVHIDESWGAAGVSRWHLEGEERA